MKSLPNDFPKRSREFWKLKVEDLASINPAMMRCLRLAALAAESDVPVLLLGETGTGKTLLACAIHNSSARASGPFVSFNASAISDTLLESHLFGHEKGAFTGADKQLRGKFELADSGTLFLDEIADMSSLAQAKILRAVEYGEFERLGSERMQRANTRIMTATNCSLPERIREKRFREDLYYRLSGLTLRIPPLRERKEELPALIATEFKAAARAANKTITALHPDAMKKLLSHHWRGNLRELHHVMRMVVLFCEGEVVLPEMVVFDNEMDVEEGQGLTARDLPRASQAGLASGDGRGSGAASGDGQGAGSEFELSRAVAEHVRAVYEHANRNQRRAAKLLGISRSTLSRHLKNLNKPEPEVGS